MWSGHIKPIFSAETLNHFWIKPEHQLIPAKCHILSSPHFHVVLSSSLGLPWELVVGQEPHEEASGWVCNGDGISACFLTLENQK